MIEYVAEGEAPRWWPRYRENIISRYKAYPKIY